MKNVDIKLNSKIEVIIQQSDGESLQIGYKDGRDLVYESFDAIILTIPPPHIRMIPERPYFGPDKERALRTSYFKPASKMGLRFNTRFWERSDLELPPCLGGRSVTDHPIRRVLYPSHGIGDGGKGVLCVYTVDDDTEQITLLSQVERIKLALHGLQTLYPEVTMSMLEAMKKIRPSSRRLSFKIGQLVEFSIIQKNSSLSIPSLSAPKETYTLLVAISLQIQYGLSVPWSLPGELYSS